MTHQTTGNESTMNTQIPLSVLETIDRAAALKGLSAVEFIIKAALEKADEVIQDHNVINLAPEDQVLLAEALTEEKVKEPTPFLKEAMAVYAATAVDR